VAGAHGHDAVRGHRAEEARGDDGEGGRGEEEEEEEEERERETRRVQDAHM
jgi:hypothetical protein